MTWTLLFFCVLIGIAPVRYILVEGSMTDDFRPVPAFLATLLYAVALMGWGISIFVTVLRSIL